MSVEKKVRTGREVEPRSYHARGMWDLQAEEPHAIHGAETGEKQKTIGLRRPVASSICCQQDVRNKGKLRR